MHESLRVHKIGTGRNRPGLSQIYRKLSVYLEILKSMEAFFECPAQRFFSTVLEEDLNALLEECEDYLIMGLSPTASSFVSLRARSETVMEEVSEVLCRQKWDAALPGSDVQMLPQA